MTKHVVGVIGTGRIGQLHIKNLIQLNNVRVKTASDPMADKLQDWFKNSGVENFVENADDIINDSEINVVFICSSTDTHLDFIERSIDAGKHVFCEKPISFSQEETRKVYEKVKNSKLKVQIGFNRRFDGNFAKIKSNVDKGNIGHTQMIKISSRDPEAPPIEYVKTSGGLFFDMMIHDFDMARFLGGEITEVYAQGDALINSEITKYNDIDTALVTLKFENGAHGVIDNSRQAAYGYDQRVEVFGSKGQVLTDNNKNTEVKLYTKDTVIEDNPQYFFLERYNDAYVSEINDFLDAITNNNELTVTYEDGMKAQNLAFAARESFEKGKPVKVNN